jgi:hypothetical protein
MTFPHKALFLLSFLPLFGKWLKSNSGSDVSPIRAKGHIQISPENLFFILFVIFVIIFFALLWVNEIWALFYCIGFVCGSSLLLVLVFLE